MFCLIKIFFTKNLMEGIQNSDLDIFCQGQDNLTVLLYIFPLLLYFSFSLKK